MTEGIRQAIAYEQDTTLRKTLNAVMELHPAHPLTDEECRTRAIRRGTIVCLGPDHPRNPLGLTLDDTYWPCPTVRAIASALGVQQP